MALLITGIPPGSFGGNVNSNIEVDSLYFVKVFKPPSSNSFILRYRDLVSSRSRLAYERNSSSVFKCGSVANEIRSFINGKNIDFPAGMSHVRPAGGLFYLVS